MKTSVVLRFVILFFYLLSLPLTAQTTVVLRPGGSITTASDWGDAPTGTVNVLSDFTANHVYSLTANNASVGLSVAWNITSSSTVCIGDGSSAFTLVYSGSGAIGTTDANVVLSNNATLVLNRAYNFNASKTTYNSSSTVVYSSGTSSVATDQYNNLSIEANVASNSATVDVLGNLSINSGVAFMIDNSGVLNVSGDVLNTGGTLSGDNTGALTFSGSGITHLRFTSGSENFATVNLLPSYFLALYTPLNVSGNFQLSGGGRLWFLGGSLFLNGAVNFGSHLIRGSGSATIQIAGSGAVSGSLDMEGAGWQFLSELTLNRSGASLSVSSPLIILNSLNPTSGTITTNNNVTLYSDASFKGRVGPISASGTLNGNLTVNVFKPAGLTGWINLCSAGVTGKTFADWNSSFAITCPSGCPDGSQVAGQPFTSIYSYLESATTGSASASAHYVALPGTSTSIDSKSGYWVYLGDNYPNTSAITIPLTGAVNTKTSSGNINLTLSGSDNSEDGWNLVANPYPSPIQVSQFIASAGGSNIDNTLQVYDPDTDSNVPLTSGNVIPMGQAFLVRARVGSVSVTPDESWKTTTADITSIQKQFAGNAPLGNNGRPYYFNEFLIDLQSTDVAKNFFTQAYFSFGNKGTPGFDNGKDAYSLESSVDPGTPRLYSITGNESFLRNALPSVYGTLSIPLKVVTGYPGTYKLLPVNLNKLPSGACVVLYDLINNVHHDLRTGAYTTTLSASNSQTAPQFELIITSLPSTLSSSTKNPLCSTSQDAYLTAKGSGNGPWNYTWRDENNTLLKYSANQPGADSLKFIGQGVYRLEVNPVGTCKTASKDFTLQALTPLPVADFTSNTNSVSAQSNVPVSFTNLSQNATEFTWEFGNGASVSSFHTNYTYNVPGLYTVKLTAGNGPCQDLDQKSIQVQVLDMPLDITQHEFANDELVLVQEASGIYLLVNSGESNEFVLTAYNALGQTLIKEKAVRPVNGRIDIQIPTSENLLFVKLSNENKSKTFKLVH